MNKLTRLFLGSSILLLGAVGCDVADTSSDVYTDIEDGVVVENPGEIEKTLEDANSKVRQDQLSSDIRAREQHNDVIREQGERTDFDLESEVRAKLEANVPRSKLTIQAEDGKVAIALPSIKCNLNTINSPCF